MIRLARSPGIKSFMQSRASLSGLARRFVGGSDLRDALATCRRLREAGIRASLFYLGEYVSDPHAVRRTVELKSAAAAALGSAGLDVHVSVDPTQVGSLISADVLRESARTIARAVRDASGADSSVLMLDMEDDTVVDDTIALHRDLVGQGLPAGITLQAYLRRTGDDLDPLVDSGATVRLVKGAFAAGPEIAHTTRAAIENSFLSLGRAMLSSSARAAGFYPVFATHDHRLIERIATIADSEGWPREGYEFEMLHGVRPEVQRALAREGYGVRAYVPFGEDWWPYAVRRVGENPRNAGLLLRAATDTLSGKA